MKKAFLVGLCSISTLSLFGCADSAPEYVGGENYGGDFKVSQFPNVLIKATGSMVQYTVSDIPLNIQNSLCITVGRETVCDNYEDEDKRKYYFTYPTKSDPNAYIVVPVSFINENSVNDNKLNNGTLDTNIRVFYYDSDNNIEYNSNIINKVTFENPRSYKLDKPEGFNNNNGNDSLKVTLYKNPNSIYTFSSDKTNYGHLKVLNYDNSIKANTIKAINSQGNSNFQIVNNPAAGKDAELTFTISRKEGIRGDAIVSVPMNGEQDVMKFNVLNGYKSLITVKDVKEKISSTSKYLVKEIHGQTDNVVLKCYSPAEHCNKLKIGNVRKDNVAELIGIKAADLNAVKDKTFYINVVQHTTNNIDKVIEQFVLDFNNLQTYSTINLKKGNITIDKDFTLYRKYTAGAFFTIRSDINMNEQLGMYDVVTDISVSKEPILKKVNTIKPSNITLVEIDKGANNPYIELLNEKSCINSFNNRDCRININPLKNTVLEEDPASTTLTIKAGLETRVYTVKVTDKENINDPQVLAF